LDVEARQGVDRFSNDLMLRAGDDRAVEQGAPQIPHRIQSNDVAEIGAVKIDSAHRRAGEIAALGSII